MISLQKHRFFLVFLGIVMFISFLDIHPTLAAQRKRLQIQPQTNQPKPVHMQAIWFLVQNQMRATIGLDPCITVKEILQTDPSSFDLGIHVHCDDQNKAEALAKVLRPRVERAYSFNMIVTNKNDEPLPHGPLPDPRSKTYIEDVKTLYITALTGNPRFVAIVNGAPWHTFFILFSSVLVQYFADDFAEATHCKSETPSDAFGAVLTLDAMSELLDLNIGPSTELNPPPAYTSTVLDQEPPQYTLDTTTI